MTCFLGIDASLRGTGLCLAEVGGAILLETVDTSDLRGAERLLYIKHAVEQRLIACPTLVAIESYAYNSVGRVFELGEVGGVIRLLVHEHGIPYVVVAPASLKKFATGNHTAEKPEMIGAAQAAGANPADDNQADAFWLARVARAVHSRGEGLAHRYQLEVVRTVLSPPRKKTRRRGRRMIPNAI